MPPRDHTLFYDGECGFCAWMVDRILSWDRDGRLRAVALDDPEADEALASVPVDERMESFHLVTPGGDVLSGGKALPVLLDLLPAGAPLARVAARFPGLTDGAYRWVAEHRSTLSRPLKESWKRAAQRRVARR